MKRFVYDRFKQLSSGCHRASHRSLIDAEVWLRALQVMNLRSLLAAGQRDFWSFALAAKVMVRRLARDAGDAEDLQLVEQIIQRIQEALGKSAPDFEEETMSFDFFQFLFTSIVLMIFNQFECF